ncbi:hypothetical protein EON83_00190 [bacterium]|nr:MAG: hypothetical protein EON83_00190 [bacterium]
MPEFFDGEEWQTMAEAAREIDVPYSVFTNYVHYIRGLESRPFGTLRFVKKAEVAAKADEIRNYSANRQRRKRKVAA